MAAVVMPDEEECWLPCAACGERERLPGVRSTWCRLCKNAYQREYRRGIRRETRTVSPPVRDPSGCLIWQGCVLLETGYGWQTKDGKTDYAHRHAYRSAHGSIPNEMTVDHTCENKLCVEPTHLDLCTRGANVRRYFLRRAFAWAQ